MILVHGQRADAFDGLALAGAQGEAVAHQVALHAQVIGQSIARARRTCSSTTCSISGERMRNTAAVPFAQSPGAASSA